MMKILRRRLETQLFAVHLPSKKYRLISMQIPFRKMVGSIVATGKSTVFAPKLLIWQSANDATNFNEVWHFFAKKSSQVLPPCIFGLHNSNHATFRLIACNSHLPCDKRAWILLIIGYTNRWR